MVTVKLPIPVVAAEEAVGVLVAKAVAEMKRPLPSLLTAPTAPRCAIRLPELPVSSGWIMIPPALLCWD